MTEVFADRPTTLSDYLAIARRRVWIIAALPVVAAVSAFAVSETQSAVYQATARVLVNRSDIVSAITNISNPALGDPTRFLATQADVARSPVVAERTVAAARVQGATAPSLLGSSHVTPDANADILDVTVSWGSPAAAVRLVNAYADEFTHYQTQLDTQRIAQALTTLRGRIKQLQGKGATATASYSQLLQYQSQLETIGTLLANNTSVLQPATSAVKTQPRPSRNAAFGGLLGLVLGIGLAFAAEALDRRVRTEDEIEQILELPLLGRIPTPPKQLRDARRPVMIADPAGTQAESVRKLKTSIEFVNLDRRARTLMVTSAVPREGKSTTAANLAIAFARAGRRVALVDLDLRRPSLHSLLVTGLEPGIADVVAGKETLERALRTVPLPAVAPSANGSRRRSSNGTVGAVSPLSVLPAGVASAITGTLAEFLESPQLAAVLDELASRFELVLLDTPPLLAVGDAIALTAHVDALLLVLQARSQRPLLRELARQLQQSQAPTLGFVLTGLDEAAAYGGYGYGYAYGAYTHDFESAGQGTPAR